MISRKQVEKIFDLKRFHEAQKYDYDIALSEVRKGRKKSCWMWYIFPQLAGLGFSSMAQYYGISGLQEAKEYLQDPTLGARLMEISAALLELEENDAAVVMGVPDNLKLRSSMTLFQAANPEIKVFAKVLDKFFDGEPDQHTLNMLGK